MSTSPEPPAAQQFRMVEEGRADAVLVRCEGELDLASAPTLLQTLTRLVGEEPALPIVLDLAGVAFMDSSGLRALIEADRVRREAGRSMALLAPSAPVLRVLELVNLRHTFTEIDALEPEELARLAEG
ncbi:MAG: anti-sigma factor antagonist [Miltoncostaeaceae bacterium]|nr:anti-sigma factor antagonist [Miltoncostaeaceae bacterium]